MNKYDDIINLPHHVSTKRPRMSLEERSSQFAPFAALNGYEESTIEEARLTNKRIYLSDDDKEILNKKIILISEEYKNSEIKITYFIKDNKKVGGTYNQIKDKIKKIDPIYKTIKLYNNQIINFNDIINIELGEEYD